MNSVVAVDTETTGLNPWKGHRIFSVAAAFSSGRILFWRDEFSGLKELMEDENVEKVFHNAKFDIRMLGFQGIKVKGKIHDTMTSAHLLNMRQKLSLEELCAKYLPPHHQKVVGEIDSWFKANGIIKAEKGTHFNILPPEILKKRNIGDAVSTLLIHQRLYPTVIKDFPFLYQQEMDLMPYILRMENRGVAVDVEEIQNQKRFLSGVIEEAEIEYEGILGREINWRSYDDKIALLDQAGLLPYMGERTKTGKYRLKAVDLRNIPHPAAQLLLRLSLASKLRDTFLAQLEANEVDGVVHGGFNSNGTVSGRFSSSKPNLQNIPREGGQLTTEEEDADLEDIPLAPHIKRCFIARPGYRNMHSDKKQIEVRQMIHYSKDITGKEILESGLDPHFMICKKMFGVEDEKYKQRAKQIVFGWEYGMGLDSMAARLQATKAQAKEYYNIFERLFPGAKRWKQRLYSEVHERGYVQTDHGRRHYLYPGEAYIAVNRMCQGTAADEIKGNMLMVGRLCEEYPDCNMLLTIHDEVSTEIPDEMFEEIAPKVHDLMCQSRIEYFTPMPADSKMTEVGGRWAELKKIKFTEGKLVKEVKK